MLIIEVNGEEVDITPDISIRFEMISPLFNMDSIEGSFTFPVKLPLTPRNKRIFNYISLINNRSNIVSEYDVKVKFKTETFFSGLLSINSITDSISVSMYSGPGHFAKVIENKKLTDLYLGGPREYGFYPQDIIDHANNTAAGTVDDFDYVFFPYVNPKVYDGQNADFNNDGIVNYWDSSANTFMQNDIMTGKNSEYCISPLIYASYLMKQLFLEMGYNAFGSFFEDTELNQLVIYNNYMMDSAYDQVSFNFFSNTINLKNHVPRISLKDFLIEFRKPFLINYIFDWRKPEVEITTMRDILLSPKVKDWTLKSFREINEITQENSGWFLSFVPDETDTPEPPVKDFAANNIIGLLENKTTIGTPPYYYWSDDGGQYDLRLYRETNIFYYRSSYNAGTVQSWYPYSQNFAPFTIGKGETRVASLFSPWFQRYERFSQPDLSKPYIENIGYSLTYNKDGENYPEFGCRLTFYRGIRSVFETSYPLASSTNYDNENNILGNYSLYWDGDEGLYAQWYKAWLDKLANGKSCKRQLKLSLSDLLNFSFKDKIAIQNGQYLIKKLAFTLSNSGISPVEANLHRL